MGCVHRHALPVPFLLRAMTGVTLKKGLDHEGPGSSLPST